MKLLVIFGVIVHIILLAGVFRIYFRSPLEHGMHSYKSQGVSPAKRLVLFVADGLRAQSIYNEKFHEHAPFLHLLVKNQAAWGVAHTQVPTESRPGHVAILAGFNEDPSAITKGWQANPVEFDSVINQSTNAWCWGSPDIVNLFTHNNASHIHLSSYNPENEDFSGKDSTALLDKWVFDHVENFLKNQNAATCTDLCKDGNILFLHLLGLDTAGHSFKPLSTEFTINLQIVDEGVQLITALVKNFFNDSNTAFIFTSDHGMTNWGSHGDGSNHETSVPFIAWGAGIQAHRNRQDLQQNEIASLISSLIGLNVPLNSNGVVPLNYINASLQQKSAILYANTAQLLDQYIIRHNRMKRNSIPFMFKPFPELSEVEAIQGLHNSSSLIVNARYQQSINNCNELIKLSLSGLKYYHLYYQRVLLLVIGFGYIGWIVLVSISITNLGSGTYRSVCMKYRNVRLPYIHQYGPLFCCLVCIIIASLIFVQGLEYDFYVYFLFPVITWYAVIHNYKNIVILYGLLHTYTWFKLAQLLVLYTLGIELLVCTFYKSETLFYIFVILAVQGFLYRRYNNDVKLAWIGKLLFFGLSPSLIGIQSDFSRTFQMLAAFGWVLFQFSVIKSVRYIENRRVLNLQVYLLLSAFANTLFVDFTISKGYGLLTLNKYFSWVLFIACLIMPFFITRRRETRCLSSIIAFATPYTLMSSGCESLFLFVFTQHMLNWIFVEYSIHTQVMQKNPNIVINFTHTFTDENTVRRCFYLLLFIMMSFFGVGNIASLNSFNPMWVRCFVTVFSPFTMATLIIIKLIIPFMIVLMAFRSVVRVSQSQIHNCFLIILLFCNLMVLQFFFLVKDTGSWLEIGLSLSRFIVCIVTTIALMLLYGMTKIFDTWLLYFHVNVNS